MAITNIREIYGRGFYLANLNGQPACIPKKSRSGLYRRLQRAVQDGEPILVLPQVILTPDTGVIQADGLDEALVEVEVKGAGELNSIDLFVEGLTETVALAENKGLLGPIASLSPGVINISVADRGAYHGEPLQIVVEE